jgi:hypothetical protein
MLIRSLDVQFVELLQKFKLRERLRTAREAFAQKFPLHERLWLAWVSDACNELAENIIQLEEVLALAQRAVQDYQTAGLWHQLLEYVALHAMMACNSRSRRMSNTSPSAAGSFLCDTVA